MPTTRAMQRHAIEILKNTAAEVRYWDLVQALRGRFPLTKTDVILDVMASLPRVPGVVKALAEDTKGSVFRWEEPSDSLPCLASKLNPVTMKYEPVDAAELLTRLEAWLRRKQANGIYAVTLGEVQAWLQAERRAAGLRDSPSSDVASAAACLGAYLVQGGTPGVQ